MAKNVGDLERTFENLTTNDQAARTGTQPIPPEEFIDIHADPSNTVSEPVQVPGATPHHQATDSGDEYVSADEGEDRDELCKPTPEGPHPHPCSEPSAEDTGLAFSGQRIPSPEDDTEPVPDEFDDTEGASAADEEFEDKEEKKEKEKKEEEARRRLEESLTEDEKQERKNTAQELKDEGNKLFKEGNFEEALMCYTKALQTCPLVFLKERSIMFSNRAACKMRLDKNEDAIEDCSKALEIHPQYLKALLRRAELYEKKEKLDEALEDYNKAVEIDPSQHMYRAHCMRLTEAIKERNEKMKAEMMGKLKDLGNMLLKPFGLSANNFKLEKDPNTGGYSVQFQQ